jgi:CheY-like chemotaxis protein
MGHQVRTADTVAAALRAADAEAFDLLLCDVGLPDGTGLDLMRQLLNRAGKPVRGIALSGFGMESDIRSSREAGFAAHLVKPVNLNELASTIQRVAQASG